MGNHGSNLDDILAEDMHHWYNKFMRESPSGLITLFELKAILGLKGMSENANSYVEQVFFTFDMDGVRSHTHTAGAFQSKASELNPKYTERAADLFYVCWSLDQNRFRNTCKQFISWCP